MNKLNQGLWPLILNNVNQIISTNYRNKTVVVIEAALLIQANWIGNCHEVWSCIIPPNEVKEISIKKN